MALGSSNLWNHIMYFVWNLQDSFLSAFAAMYCAFVPWEKWYYYISDLSSPISMTFDLFIIIISDAINTDPIPNHLKIRFQYLVLGTAY